MYETFYRPFSVLYTNGERELIMSLLFIVYDDIKLNCRSQCYNEYSADLP